MKTSLCLLLLALSALTGLALELPAKTPPPTAPTAEVTLTGVLQRRVSIGGETTGWVLRYEKDRTIELTFSIAALAQIREGAWVACTGTYEIRHYPERGEVRVLVVREINEIVT